MLRFAVLCLAGLTAATARSVEEETPPKWGPVFSVKGIFSLPLEDVQESFEGWFDVENKKSRVSYNGDAVTVYVLPKSNSTPAATLRKDYHQTTEYEINELACLVFYPDENDDDPFKVALPDMTHFTFMGTENITTLNLKVSKWQRLISRCIWRYEFTMWITYKEGPEGSKQPMPIKYEVNVYTIPFGTHTTRNVYEFSDYRTEDIDMGAFEVKNNMTCKTTLSKYDVRNIMDHYMNIEKEASVAHQFEMFKSQHGRQYASDAEHNKRLEIFMENLRYIEEHNRGGHSFKMAVNHLADRTLEELAALRGARRSAGAGQDQGLPFPYTTSELQELAADLPKQFDWRLHGAVTPVKDQLQCGSCWAFGSVDAVEGALFLHRNRSRLVRLSEQALIDCSWGFGNLGCSGGLPEFSFHWMKKHGLPTYEAYGGYLAENGLCHINNLTDVVLIKDWVHVRGGDENALKVAIFKNGPVAVAINAGLISFQFYSSGIYYDPSCDPSYLDHIVLAVGFGELDGETYWLIKNSWGSSWGANGYILVATKDNNCGVTNIPCYVVF